MSTLGNLRVLRAEVHVPPAGAWYGTLVLDSSTLPALGATTLTIGDLQLVGAIVRTDFDDHVRGALPMAVVRGGAGWRLPAPRAGTYASSGGVRLRTVLRDLAAASGEGYVEPTDVSLGTAYTWQAHAPAAPVHLEDVLADLVWRGYLPTWRVDPSTGVTRFDAWPARGASDGRGRVTGRNLARGRRSVGLDVQVAAFLPGATLEGAAIRRLVIHESAAELRAEVYSPVSSTSGASSSSASAAGTVAGSGGAGAPGVAG